MKESLNQHVTHNRRNKIRYVLQENSTRNDTLDYFWRFEIILDLMSQVENKFK